MYLFIDRLEVIGGSCLYEKVSLVFNGVLNGRGDDSVMKRI